MSTIATLSDLPRDGRAPEPQVFEIGLSMSGAISAGAYTAGVFDFLILALDEWEKHRGSDDYRGPSGRAALKVMAGASAGAIIAAVGVVALSDPPVPVHSKSRLYRAWVVKPAFTAASGGRDFLSLDDLDTTSDPPASALNAKLLDDIAAEALVRGKVTAKPRSYVSANLHVYMTLTDLRGTPYSIDFTGDQGYHMVSHARRAHYTVQGLGTWRCESPFADDDPGVILDANSLKPAGSPASADWHSFTEAALGSAAYPVGLAARRVDVTYEAVKFPTSEQHPPQPVATAFDPTQFPPKRRYRTVTVDGGVIDNDPFEYARYTLMWDPPIPNARCGKTASRAVLMIAPFPEAPTLVAEGEPPTTIAAVALGVLGALRQQVRFKPDQLLAVRDETVFSRFMISPKRVLPGQVRGEKFTIASGLLDGFGGFISQAFRDHDYQLGRRNCQAFLRRTFALAAKHPYFEGCRLKPMPPEGIIDFETLPIIPLYGAADVEVECQTWPRLPMDDFETLMKRIARRLSAVLAKAVGRSVFWRLVVAFGKGRILDYLRWYIMADMIERNQICGFDVPDPVLEGLQLPPGLLRALKLQDDKKGSADFVRLIAARLADPKFDYRCARGITSSLGLPQVETSPPLGPSNSQAVRGASEAAEGGGMVRRPGADETAEEAGTAETVVANKMVEPVVEQVLERLASLGATLPIAVWRVPWRTGARLYCLAARKPSTIRTWLGGRSPLPPFKPPVTDYDVVQSRTA